MSPECLVHLLNKKILSPDYVSWEKEEEETYWRTRLTRTLHLWDFHFSLRRHNELYKNKQTNKYTEILQIVVNSMKEINQENVMGKWKPS